MHHVCSSHTICFLLPESGIPFQVVAAIDINTTANQIYRHNFPDTPLWNKTIEVGGSGGVRADSDSDLSAGQCVCCL